MYACFHKRRKDLLGGGGPHAHGAPPFPPVPTPTYDKHSLSVFEQNTNIFQLEMQCSHEEAHGHELASSTDMPKL